MTHQTNAELMTTLEDYIKLADAATEGPWTISRYSNYTGWSVSANGRGCIAERWYDVSCPYPDDELTANSNFIAASRALGPAMAKALIEAEGALKNVQMLISEGAKHGMNAIDNPEWGMRLYESNQKTSQSLATIQRLRNGGV